MTDDFAQARDFAEAIGAEVPQVEEVYLVGSRAKGSARPDSDFDIIAVV